MRIEFEIAGVRVLFRRNNFFNSADLRTPTETIVLQSAWAVNSAFSTSLVQQWHLELLGARLLIEKTRPLLFPYLRPNHYRILVNGEVVAEANGY